MLAYGYSDGEELYTDYVYIDRPRYHAPLARGLEADQIQRETGKTLLAQEQEELF